MYDILNYTYLRTEVENKLIDDNRSAFFSFVIAFLWVRTLRQTHHFLQKIKDVGFKCHTDILVGVITGLKEILYSNSNNGAYTMVSKDTARKDAIHLGRVLSIMATIEMGKS